MDQIAGQLIRLAARRSVGRERPISIPLRGNLLERIRRLYNRVEVSAFVTISQELHAKGIEIACKTRFTGGWGGHFVMVKCHLVVQDPVKRRKLEVCAHKKDSVVMHCRKGCGMAAALHGTHFARAIQRAIDRQAICSFSLSS